MDILNIIEHALMITSFVFIMMLLIGIFGLFLIFMVSGSIGPAVSRKGFMWSRG